MRSLEKGGKLLMEKEQPEPLFMMKTKKDGAKGNHWVYWVYIAGIRFSKWKCESKIAPEQTDEDGFLRLRQNTTYASFQDRPRRLADILITVMSH